MLIETERLLLRPLTFDDVDEVVAMHTTAEVIAWMGSFERSTAIQLLESNEREWRERGYGRVAIVERATDRFVGRSGLKYWPHLDEVEVGWVLHPGFWGHGFATEAGRACLEWGFASLDVPYLIAMILPHNTRSIRVAERLGMHPLRDDVLGGLPVVVYSVEHQGITTCDAMVQQG